MIASKRRKVPSFASARYSTSVGSPDSTDWADAAYIGGNVIGVDEDQGIGADELVGVYPRTPSIDGLAQLIRDRAFVLLDDGRDVGRVVHERLEAQRPSRRARPRLPTAR